MPQIQMTTAQQTSDNHCHCMAFVGAIRVPALLLGTCAPVAGFLLCFSKMGYGTEVYHELSEYFEFSLVCFRASVGILFFLYIFDFSFWRGTFLTSLKHSLLFLVVLGISVGGVLSMRDYPYAPMALFMAGMPIYFSMIKAVFYSHIPDTQFLTHVSYTLTSCAVAVFVLWASWIHLTDSGWNKETKEKYKKAMDCSDAEYCLAAFLLWATPLMAGMACATFGFFAYFLGWSLVQAKSEQFALASRLFTLILFVGIVGTWVGASVAGAGMGMSTVVNLFTFLFLGEVTVLVCSTYGWAAMHNTIMSVPLVQRLKQSLLSDWMRAMFVMVCMPVFFCYLCLSMINQQCRRCFHCANLDHDAYAQKSKAGLEADHGITAAELAKNEELHHSAGAMATPGAQPKHHAVAEGEVGKRNSAKMRIAPMAMVADSERTFPCLTRIVDHQLEEFVQWRWASILVKVCYIAIFVMSFQVGVGKVVTVFLSWLNEYLKAYSLRDVTFIFGGVGLFMFLLPPVPGVPVYISGGIILTKAGLNANYSFIVSLLYTTIVCFGIKLCAVAIQQKAFGVLLGNQVWVRAFVGVNSLAIRAIRLILQRPGMGVAKVAILCGGPDWPTSVLTGILDLRLLPMLWGSFPVYFLIAPCCAAGGFMLKKDEGGIWPSLASATIVVATIVQTFALLIAAYFIEGTAARHGEALKKEPDDEEVRAMDEQRLRSRREYAALVNWHDPSFPSWVKVWLGSAAVLMTACCYLFGLFNSYCFKMFEVSQTWEEGLDGDPWSIVKPHGWVAFAMFGAACVQLIVFLQWAARRVVVARARQGVGTATERAAHTAELESIDDRSEGQAMALSNPTTAELCAAQNAVAGGAMAAGLSNSIAVAGSSKIMV